jgi:hypothetical protein
MALASRKLLKEAPSEADTEKIMNDLSRLSHRDAAIIGTSYLEAALEFRLKKTLRQDLKADERNQLWGRSGAGIMGGLASKVLIAFATKLIGRQTKDDLWLINDIRNVFAHTLHIVDFTHPLLQEDVKQLSNLRRFYEDIGRDERYERIHPPAFENFCIMIEGQYKAFLYDLDHFYKR